MAEVTVTVARVEDRPAITNMMQLYIHDFSEQWMDLPRGELGDKGFLRNIRSMPSGAMR